MISAIVLAAGQSKRMGRSKMLLPWGNSTVLRQVVDVLQNSEIDDIVVVTGGERAQVEKSIADLRVRIAYNEDYINDEMLSSVQIGLTAQLPGTEAALICLGDQPQIQKRSVRQVYEAFSQLGASLVVPSYQMHRGHPWLVARPLWNDLLEMESPQTPRDFLNAHASEIEYVQVKTPSVIEDLDTPEDYLKFKP